MVSGLTELLSFLTSLLWQAPGSSPSVQLTLTGSSLWLSNIPLHISTTPWIIRQWTQRTYMESRKRHWWAYLRSRNRDTDAEHGLADLVGEGEGWMNRETRPDVHTRTASEKVPHTVGTSARRSATWCGAGWGRVGREAASGPRGVCTLYTQAAWQRPTRHCKAFILQLKVNLKTLEKLKNF